MAEWIIAICLIPVGVVALAIIVVAGLEWADLRSQRNEQAKLNEAFDKATSGVKKIDAAMEKKP